jgi:hypothetical protein
LVCFPIPPPCLVMFSKPVGKLGITPYYFLRPSDVFWEHRPYSDHGGKLIEF